MALHAATSGTHYPATMSAVPELEHAAAYPFDIPRRSYVFNPLDGTSGPFNYDMICDDALIPVAAVGSNASPSQLRRKFPPDGPLTDPIPVLHIEFRGVNTVYAARVSTYGSIPATAFPSPGTWIRLHITFLNDRQLERMNQTESLGVGYELAEMPGNCAPQLHGRQILTFAARSGALMVDGQPAALECTPASNRVFAEISEMQAIDIVADTLGFSAAELVCSVIENRELHARINETLAPLGSKWPYPVHDSQARTTR